MPWISTRKYIELLDEARSARNKQTAAECALRESLVTQHSSPQGLPEPEARRDAAKASAADLRFMGTHYKTALEVATQRFADALNRVIAETRA